MSRGKRLLAPYLLVLPGGLWLLLFFVVPMVTMLSLSLQQGDIVSGYVFTGHWQTYVDAIVDYKTQLIRSLIYGAIATIAADRGGVPGGVLDRLLRRPAQVDVPVPAAAAVLRVVRAADDLVAADPHRRGLRCSARSRTPGCCRPSFHILGTPVAVIGGLVYNFLPFMVLPIYVALERIDPRVVEAARDLYADPATAFRKVILPLALPGVFAGVLMTFVPASSDYVNSAVLGSSSTTMIGQVIQAQYLANSNYPTASALSFTADGGAADRRLRLRAGAGHRGRHEGGGAMTEIPGQRRRGCCGAYTWVIIAWLALPVLVMIVVRLQRHPGPLQPVLGGLHPQVVRPALRARRAHQGPGHLAGHRGRDDARSPARWAPASATRWAATGSAAPARST